MNAVSSRSHAVLTITIESYIKPKTDESGKPVPVTSRKRSKLHLIDLAGILFLKKGSERAESTGATGALLKEGAAINLSLSALGNVINALTLKNKAHVPYRDSKLTFLLSDSLGGNSLTLLIACVTPIFRSYEETLGTLRFAQRAKKVENSAKLNVDSATLKILELEGEVKRLKDLLLKCQCGVYQDNQEHEALKKVAGTDTKNSFFSPMRAVQFVRTFSLTGEKNLSDSSAIVQDVETDQQNDGALKRKGLLPELAPIKPPAFRLPGDETENNVIGKPGFLGGLLPPLPSKPNESTTESTKDIVEMLENNGLEDPKTKRTNGKVFPEKIYPMMVRRKALFSENGKVIICVMCAIILLLLGSTIAFLVLYLGKQNLNSIQPFSSSSNSSSCGNFSTTVTVTNWIPFPSPMVSQSPSPDFLIIEPALVSRIPSENSGISVSDVAFLKNSYITSTRPISTANSFLSTSLFSSFTGFMNQQFPILTRTPNPVSAFSSKSGLSPASPYIVSLALIMIRFILALWKLVA